MALASSFHEPRFAPLSSTFIDVDADDLSPPAMKRSSSFAGYIPYSLEALADEMAKATQTTKTSTIAKADVALPSPGINLLPAMGMYSPGASPLLRPQHRDVPSAPLNPPSAALPSAAPTSAGTSSNAAPLASTACHLLWLPAPTPAPAPAPVPCHYHVSTAPTAGPASAPVPLAAPASADMPCHPLVKAACIAAPASAPSISPSMPPAQLQLFHCLQAASPPRSQGHNCVNFNCQKSASPMATQDAERPGLCAPIAAPPRGSKGSVLSLSDLTSVSASLDASPTSSLHPSAPPSPSIFQRNNSTELAAEGPQQLIKQSGRNRQGRAATDAKTSLSQGVTTVMIRNIPADIAQSQFLEDLDSFGFAGTYDFAYMPQSFDKHEGKGFGFVNFKSPSFAEALFNRWHKQHIFGTGDNIQAVNISEATHQGLEANLRKWNTPRLRRIRNPNLRPFVAQERAKARQ